MWAISEERILGCINCAIATGELPTKEFHHLKLKRSSSEREKQVSPDFVFVDVDDVCVRPCSNIIDLGIRAGCLDDMGHDNIKYHLSDLDTSG
jgi:hypothetical protein